MWLSPRADFNGLSVIDHIYNWLDGLYPFLWRNRFQNKVSVENFRKTWAAAFTEQQVTFEEVRLGLRNCQTLYEKPPTFPEFLKACRPPLDYDAAYEEAVVQARRRREFGDDRWSNPAIFWAAAEVGHDLTHLRYADFRPRWIRALDQAVADVRAKRKAVAVPAKPRALPADVGTPTADLAKVRSMMDELRRKIAAGQFEEGGEP